MRPIKFHAWYGQHDIPQMIPYEIPQPEGMKIMQFTGLLDKDGKEIYEGDIFKRDNDTYEVSWNGTDAEWQAWKSKMEYLHLDIYEVETAEVIGNIYENPELISK